MNLVSRFRSFVSALAHRSRLGGEIDEELRAHIEDRANHLERSGLPRAEAERQARLEFGGYQKFKEECRESRGTRFIDSLLQDIRFALRMLRKSPAFTAVAILTLGLGIGANTAIFSVVDAVLLRPLPYPDSDSLVMVYQSASQSGRGGLSYPNFQDWQRAAHDFDEMVAMRTSEFALSGSGEATNVIAGAVTPGYFSMFRVTPILGRTFEPGDDVPGAAGSLC